MIQESIIRNHHDSRVAGHPGIYKTLELVNRDYWWPSVGKDVREYVQGCQKCQRTKARRRINAPLYPNEVPKEAWEVVSVDLIGPLPESGSYNAICVFVDCLTKMVKIVPTNTELSSEGQAQLFRDVVFQVHGIPRKVISDWGPQYAS